MKNGIFFVARLKTNSIVENDPRRAGRKAKGITEDREISLGHIPESLRLICFLDPETGKELRFVTNAVNRRGIMTPL